MELLEAVERKFYDYNDEINNEREIEQEIQTEELSNDNNNETDNEKESLLSFIRNSIIGEDKNFETPFGTRKLLYCDYTASGRSLGFIEDYIRDEVLPLYGNTHTTTSITGRQSTFYRHESREYIKRCMNGKEEDALLFCGTGSTAAVNRLIDLLNLRNHSNNAQNTNNHSNSSEKQENEPENDKKKTNNEENEQKVVVFVSIFEHHSNLLPWREINAIIETINEDQSTGEFDILQLKKLLQKYQNKKYKKIGAFTAASNITGIFTNQLLITFLLHQFGAFSFWDFATAAPYVKIDMNPLLNEYQANLLTRDIHKYQLLSSSSSSSSSNNNNDNIINNNNNIKNNNNNNNNINNNINNEKYEEEIEEIIKYLQNSKEILYKDAIYLSPHKFIGGVGTPGLLLLKRKLINNKIPSQPGGGTIFFVTENDHRYLRQIEEREEGGTPDIVGSIRIGLFFLFLLFILFYLFFVFFFIFCLYFILIFYLYFILILF